MTRACLFFLSALALASVAGCVLDQHLGDADTDTSGATGNGDAGGPDGTADDGGASMSASSSSPATMSADTGSGSGPPTTVTNDGGSGTASDPTGEPGQTCFDWAAPPADCETPGGATAQVTGDLLPLLQDQPCIVASVEHSGLTQDTVTLDCGDVYVLQISTDAPHLDLPIAGGEDVRVTSAEPEFSIDELVPSFVLRDVGGDLLLAWVNVYGHGVEVDVDIDPVVVSVAGSGCGTSHWVELCDGDGAIALQRSMLQLGAGEPMSLLFDGNQAITTAGAEDVSVIAETVESIVCWDDDCGGDDSGPFDRITFFFALLPSG